MPGAALQKGKAALSVIKLSDYENRRAMPNAEYFRILVDCRDLTTHRMLVSFTSMMDRLGDRLLEQANASSVLSESTLLLETRAAVHGNRAYIVSAFESGLRERIDRRLRGEQDADNVPTGEEEGLELELVDHNAVEEDIALKNFVRSLVDSCHDQLLPLNARIGFLLGERELATEDNPFGPMALGLAFRDAWRDVEMRAEGKVVAMRMMDGGVIGDINSIYADLNRHLANLNVLPNLTPMNIVRAGAGRVNAYANSAAAARAEAAAGERAGPGAPAAPESDADLFEMLRDLFGKIQRSGRAQAQGAPGGAPNFAPGGWPAGYAAQPGGGGDANPWSSFGVAQDLVPIVTGAFNPAAFGQGGVSPFSEGYLVDPQVISSLTRLQQEFGGGPGGGGYGGPPVMGGIVGPAVAIDPNVLRRLTPRDLGTNVDATGAMTIELVAMLFDFVSADRQLPDAIKALLGRLQIPVLKAAMLDKEFFSRRKHPARLLVNRYAEAGIAWQPEHGTSDPLYLKIQEGVGRIQCDFTDQLDLFADVLADFESYLAEEERKAEQVVQASAEDITTNERQELAEIVADAELDRRINSAQPPEFLERFLRAQWRSVLVGTYLDKGEESDEWRGVLADMDNLLWSVQPKRSPDARKDLVGRLPGLLSRLRSRLADIEWDTDARDSFMSDLAATHARAVTATKDTPLIAAETPSPLTSPLATAIAESEIRPVGEHDQYHELAETMTRGMWVEFTEENDALVFAKLSWVSPLRGKYLFTHRNGLKAFSLTREELAQRFRDDTARPVESEPLLDRAFSDVMSRLSAQVGA
jgi:predicted RNA-binding Zn ribbon-like protein